MMSKSIFASQFIRHGKAAILAASLALCACEPPLPDAAIGDPAPAPLHAQLVQVRVSPLPPVHAVAGTLQAHRQVRIAPRLDGRIIQVMAGEGTLVKKGDVMVKLDGRELTAKRTQARANVQALQQKLDYLKTQQQRVHKLASEGVAPPSTVDEIDVNVITTESQLKAARGVLAEADSAFADLLIKAPFDGRVNHQFSEVGDYALPSEPLMTLEDTSKLKVVIALGTYETSFLRGKDTVLLNIDGRPGQVEARVKAILPSGTGLVPGHRAVLELDNGDGSLEAGAIARLVMVENLSRPMVDIPETSLERRDGWNGVYIVRGGRLLFSWVTIETDPVPGRPIRVLSGLNPGDIIAVSADEARRSGMLGRRISLN